MIKIINKVGFDINILGNHEFDYGIEKLMKLGKNLTTNYICSNFCYRENKTTIFGPYKVLEVNNKKLPFLAFLTPLTFSKTYLVSIKDSDGKPLYDFLTDNNAQELYDKVQEYINKLKEEEKWIM